MAITVNVNATISVYELKKDVTKYISQFVSVLGHFGPMSVRSG